MARTRYGAVQIEISLQKPQKPVRAFNVVYRVAVKAKGSHLPQENTINQKNVCMNPTDKTTPLHRSEGGPQRIALP